MWSLVYSIQRKVWRLGTDQEYFTKTNPKERNLLRIDQSIFLKATNRQRDRQDCCHIAHHVTSYDSTVQYSTVQYSTVQYSTAQYEPRLDKIITEEFLGQELHA